METTDKIKTEGNDLVIINLDRPREVKLSHKVLKRYCALTGKTLREIPGVATDYVEMTRLLWCALLREDPELTPERLDDLLERHDVMPMTVIEAVGAAIKAAFDDGEDDQTDEDPLIAAGIGETA